MQTYIRTLRKSGAVINTAICIAVAEGIVHAYDKQFLSCNGGPISLKKKLGTVNLTQAEYGLTARELHGQS